MDDLEKMREIVASGLKNYVGCPFIRSNQNQTPPAYPFGSYTITTLMSQNKGTYGVYDDDKDRKPFTQTWSLTFQSNKYNECTSLVAKAHEWLDHVGTAYLNENGVIVQSVGNITNRDNVLTNEYEYRNGFDVVFWFLNEVESTNIAKGYVEGVEFDGEYLEPVTPEMLNERLAKRLDGEI